jgi:hypothetical protein
MYAVALATTYRGLAVDAPEALPATLHASFEATFQVGSRIGTISRKIQHEETHN